jgi:hypothetical protein
MSPHQTNEIRRKCWKIYVKICSRNQQILNKIANSEISCFEKLLCPSYIEVSEPECQGQMHSQRKEQQKISNALNQAEY